MRDNNKLVRQRIIDTSRELFLQKGLKGTTVRDIAAAAGTNVAMVNYYFRSKDQLFEAIFQESFGVLTSRIFTAIDSDLPFFEMVRNWVYSYFDTLRENPQLPIFVLTEISRHPGKLEEKIRLKDSYHIYARIAIRIHKEEKKGTIRSLPVSSFLLGTVSLCIFPFIFGPLAKQLLGLPKGEYDELLREHKEFVAGFIIDALRPE